MRKCNDDTAHWDPNARIRQFQPEYIKPVSGRSTLRSNRSSGGAVVVAVNNSTMRQRANTEPFRAVMRFYRSFLAAFSLCCIISAPVSANSISDQASVIDSDIIKIRGERIKLVSVDAHAYRQTCLDAGGCAWSCGQQAALALSDISRPAR